MLENIVHSEGQKALYYAFCDNEGVLIRALCTGIHHANYLFLRKLSLMCETHIKAVIQHMMQCHGHSGHFAWGGLPHGFNKGFVFGKSLQVQLSQNARCKLLGTNPMQIQCWMGHKHFGDPEQIKYILLLGLPPVVGTSPGMSLVMSYGNPWPGHWLDHL